MIDIIKTRIALFKSEFGLIKYLITYGKMAIDLIKGMINKE